MESFINRTCLRPVIEYGLQIVFLTRDQKEKLETLQSQAARMAVPHGLLRLETMGEWHDELEESSGMAL